ncbi:hypothetical protein [Pseudomonas putida]|uniref:hypothetical protein n=1 Tax=Pseudomonas putida TaxID=303 RepID=UPI003CFCF6C9
MDELSEFNAEYGLSEIAHVLKKLEDAYATRLQSQLNTHLNERNVLVDELFKVQAALEQAMGREKILGEKLDASLKFINNIHSAVPHRWLGSAVKVGDVDTTQESKILQWHISNVFVGKRFLNAIEFRTKISSGVTYLEFLKPSDKKSNTSFTRWPACLGEGQKLIVGPSKHYTIDKNLSSLGPSDWALIKELVGDLVRFIPHSNNHIDESLAIELIAGMEKLAEAMVAQPPVLRFDHISLVEITHNGGYHGLKLRMENVVQGGTAWESIEYTLSSVDGADDHFGSNPRIEFPRTAKPFLDGWYPERQDDQGERFELRFKVPGLMDINVWNSLGEQDKIRLASLLGVLDVQFSELELQHPHVDWEIWRKLASSMKEIIAKTMLGYRQLKGINNEA